MNHSYRAVLVDYDADLFDLAPVVKARMEQVLAEAGTILEVGQYRSEEAVSQAAKTADLVLIQSVRPLLTSRVIPALARCRGIIRLGLGYDSVDVQAATRAGIPVSNVIDWCNEEVAEHAIALLMAGARKVAVLDRFLHTDQWSREQAVPIFRLQGKTIGSGWLWAGGPSRDAALARVWSEPVGVRPLPGRRLLKRPRSTEDRPGRPPGAVRFHQRPCSPDGRNLPPLWCARVRADETQCLPDQYQPRGPAG